MARFLVGTEPSTRSVAHLRRDKRIGWDGVSYPAALKHFETVEGVKARVRVAARISQAKA